MTRSVGGEIRKRGETRAMARNQAWSSELGYFLGGVKKGGTLSKSPDNGKQRKIKEEKLGVATHCCLKRKITKLLECRTATTLHMATPKEDQYPHQSYFSLDYGILSLCGRAVQPTFFSSRPVFPLTIPLFVFYPDTKKRTRGLPVSHGFILYACFL